MHFILPVFLSLCMLRPHSDSSGQALPRPVPDLLIRHVINYPRQAFQIGDLKGKVVIFDFGTVGCHPCLQLLPELDSLQQVFGDKIQVFFVTAESPQRVKYFLQNSPVGKKLHIPIIAADSILAAQFQHQFIPHEVWIDKAGNQVAQTEGDYVTAANITKVLNGEKVDWVIKHEEPYDKGESLLTFNNNNIPPPVNPVPQSLFYSTFTNHLDGVSRGFNTFIDSVKGIFRWSMINASILEMYMELEGLNPNTFPPTRILLNVADKAKVDQHYTTDFRAAWELSNAKCFEMQWPLNSSDSERKAAALMSLENFSGYSGKIVPVEVDCWVMILQTDSTPLIKKGIPSDKAGDFRTPTGRLYCINNFIGNLNFTEGCPPVLDETGLSDRLTVETYMANLQPSDRLDRVNEGLAPYGLKIMVQKRSVPMLIISDQKNKSPSENLLN